MIKHVSQLLLSVKIGRISKIFQKEIHLCAIQSNLRATTLKTKEKTFPRKNLQDELEETPSLAYDCNEYKLFTRMSFSVAHQKLADVLNITPDEACLIFANYPFLFKISPHELKTRFSILSENKVHVSILHKYPWILSSPYEIIKHKLDIIKELPMDINKIVPIIKQNESTLRKSIYYLKKEIDLVPEGNRIDFVGKYLKCPSDEVSHAIGKYSFFTKLKFDRIARILKILIAKDVPAENILNDFWIFRYRPATIENRLQGAVDSQVGNVRTWMVRCKTNTYNRTLQRHENNKKILGDLSDITEYLSKRLNLEYEYTKIIVDKHTEIKRMNTTKTKEILDYLFAEGFTASQVIRSPRILCCKLKTIQERCAKLKEFNFEPSSLVIFCKSQVQFEIYLQMIKKKISKLDKNTT